MHRYRYNAFWPLVLLVPLLLALTGCQECDAYPGPDLDPGFLSANGLIYLNSPASHSLYAIDRQSGSIRWTYQAVATHLLLLDSGVLYFQDENYQIKALDASDGTLLWHKDGSGNHFTELGAAADHFAYLSKNDGIMEAVNGRDGSVLWQHVLKGDPALVYTDDPAAVQAVNGVVYLSTKYYSGAYAFRERDGALLWQFHGSQSRLRSTAFGDGMIFISADQTYALRMSDGKLLWSSTHTGQLLEAKGVLYVNTAAPPTSSNSARAAGGSDDVFAFRASDGAQIWQQSFAPTGGGASPDTYSMQLGDQQVYLFPAATVYPAYPQYRVGATALLFAFRASDGTPLWKESLPARKFSLVALSGVLYLFSAVDRLIGPGLLEAVRGTDGTVLWSRSVQEAGMVASLDAIYLGIGGNTDPCAPKTRAQIEKLRVNDAALAWQQQLEPAPDPSRPVESILGILGGLLALLGLLLFFCRRDRSPRARRSHHFQGNRLG